MPRSPSAAPLGARLHVYAFRVDESNLLSMSTRWGNRRKKKLFVIYNLSKCCAHQKADERVKVKSSRIIYCNFIHRWRLISSLSLSLDPSSLAERLFKVVRLHFLARCFSCWLILKVKIHTQHALHNCFSTTTNSRPAKER